MSVNHASSAGAAEADGRRVPASGANSTRVRRLVLATAASAALLGLAIAELLYIGNQTAQVFTGGLTLVSRAIVWVALAAQDGADWWAIAGRAAGAIASALASSQVMWWLIGLEAIAVAALAGLHRMLRDEMRGQDSEEKTK